MPTCPNLNARHNTHTHTSEQLSIKGVTWCAPKTAPKHLLLLLASESYTGQVYLACVWSTSGVPPPPRSHEKKTVTHKPSHLTAAHNDRFPLPPARPEQHQGQAAPLHLIIISLWGTPLCLLAGWWGVRQLQHTAAAEAQQHQQQKHQQQQGPGRQHGLY
jgi:hypothetical protein